LASTSWFEVLWGTRSTVWWESLELIRRFPLLGTGLGTFEQAFPLVQAVSVTNALWGKAHNDFLEWIVTGGVVAAGVAAAGIIFLAKALISRLRSAVGSEDRAALSAALGSLAAVAVHELFDFGLSLPANAFVLTVVVAASLAVRTES
jgi:O-antigen ligase